MTYSQPRVKDLGSIADHTFYAGHSGNIKGGLPPRHVDKHCEWSGGSGIDFFPTACVERK